MNKGNKRLKNRRQYQKNVRLIMLEISVVKFLKLFILALSYLEFARDVLLIRKQLDTIIQVHIWPFLRNQQVLADLRSSDFFDEINF